MNDHCAAVPPDVRKGFAFPTGNREDLSAL
jgi:hypothetical protein